MLRRIAWHQVTCILPNKPSNDGTYFVSESPPWAAPDIRITSNVLVTNQPINQSINRSINQSNNQLFVQSLSQWVVCPDCRLSADCWPSEGRQLFTGSCFQQLTAHPLFEPMEQSVSQSINPSVLQLIMTITISSNVIGVLMTFIYTNHTVQL